MITIIKHGQKKFRAVCKTCGCEFTYELVNLNPLGNGLDCPDCGHYVVHQGMSQPIRPDTGSVATVDTNGFLHYPPGCRKFDYPPKTMLLKEQEVRVGDDKKLKDAAGRWVSQAEIED